MRARAQPIRPRRSRRRPARTGWTWPAGITTVIWATGYRPADPWLVFPPWTGTARSATTAA